MRLRTSAAVLVAGTSLALGAVVPGSAHTTPKPTVVLVHGAFADSSGWAATISGLRKAGYPVIAAANPLRDLAGDSAYVSSVLDSIKGPVVLVGHSYGGMVISNAAIGHKNVKALVYVAAFVPEPGESALQLTGRFPGSLLSSAVLPQPIPNGGTDLYISASAFRGVFAADLPKSRTEVMAATQRPVTAVALGTPSPAAAWKSIPSWYLVAGRDQAIPPAAQQFMAQRASAHTVTAPKASHVVFISQPGLAVSLVKAAAESTS